MGHGRVGVIRVAANRKSRQGLARGAVGWIERPRKGEGPKRCDSNRREARVDVRRRPTSASAASWSAHIPHFGARPRHDRAAIGRQEPVTHQAVSVESAGIEGRVRTGGTYGPERLRDPEYPSSLNRENAIDLTFLRRSPTPRAEGALLGGGIGIRSTQNTLNPKIHLD